MTLAIAACVVTLSWLWALFLFPKSWQDHYGYNQLGAILLTGALHWVVCLPLTIAYWAGKLEPSLPQLTFAAPLVFLAGTAIDGLWCLPLFIAPSVAILVYGYREVYEVDATVPTPSGTDPGTVSDAEPGDVTDTAAQ
ncbi:MAG: hypothetical protein QM811_29705 [Pirellulales bacterium]